MKAYHIHAGYPGIQHSGKTINFAPAFAASATILHVFPPFRRDRARWAHAVLLLLEECLMPALKPCFCLRRESESLKARDRKRFCRVPQILPKLPR